MLIGTPSFSAFIFNIIGDFQLAKDVTERDKIPVHRILSDLEEMNLITTVHALNLEIICIFRLPI